uniref:Uncharacterized protein n=1 Tax=Noccaea caerulescens TaxID=107243 RepID=A0A1J3HAK4_NOCCA
MHFSSSSSNRSCLSNSQALRSQFRLSQSRRRSLSPSFNRVRVNGSGSSRNCEGVIGACVSHVEHLGDGSRSTHLVCSHSSL